MPETGLTPIAKRGSEAATAIMQGPPDQADFLHSVMCQPQRPARTLAFHQRAAFLVQRAPRLLGRGDSWPFGNLKL